MHGVSRTTHFLVKEVGHRYRGNDPMLTDMARNYGRGIVDPIARLMNWAGVSPNAITLIGFTCTSAVAAVLAQGHVRLAGLLLIPASGLDAIDGTLARMMNRATRFGAFLDSTMDRYSETVLLMGALIYFQSQGASTEVILCCATLVGSQMVSYARARAQGIGVDVKDGLLTRFERTLVLIAGLIFNELTITLWVLAVFTNLTALQRIWLVWRKTGQDEPQRQ